MLTVGRSPARALEFVDPPLHRLERVAWGVEVVEALAVLIGLAPQVGVAHALGRPLLLVLAPRDDGLLHAVEIALAQGRSNAFDVATVLPHALTCEPAQTRLQALLIVLKRDLVEHERDLIAVVDVAALAFAEDDVFGLSAAPVIVRYRSP